MAIRKPAPKKKAAPKKERRDFSQVALSIVEHVTGVESLAPPPHAGKLNARPKS